MNYSIPCQCGKSLQAAASQAGTDIECTCGRLISVPPLSQLRQMAADPSSPSDETKHKRRWYQYHLRSLTIVMTVLCIWAAVAWVKKKDELHYWLLVTGSVSDDFLEKHFNDDEMLTIGGGDIGGMLTLYVNESPVHLLSFGGICIRITDGLHSGKNRVTIKGNLRNPVYAKVFTTRSPIISLAEPPIIKEVLVKRKISISDTLIHLDFEAKISFSDPRDELPQEGALRSELETELRSLIKMQVDRLQNHDGRGLKEIGRWPTGDQTVPLPSYLRDDRKRNTKNLQSQIDLLSNPTLLVLTSADEVQLIWGRKTVITYVGVGEFNDIPKPYLFRLKIDYQEGNFLPIRWVRISDRWIAW